MADNQKLQSQNQKFDRPSFKAGFLLILGLTLLIYLPSLRGGFIWDDDILLTENRAIKASGAEGLFTFWCSSKQPDYLPLTSTSLWLEWRVWGMNAAGYRVTNILLHAFSAILLWQILHRLKIPGAFWAALVFAVHPVCVASVAWIAERKNTLSMIFYLLSIWFWLRSERFGVPSSGGSGAELPERGTPGQSQKWYWLSFGSFVLALFSKGSVVILPCVLLLVAWWQRGRIDKRDVVKTALHFCAAFVFGLITIWFQFHRSSGEQFVDNLNFPGKSLAAAKAVWFYISKAVWPTNLSMIYPPWKIETNQWWSYVPVILLIATFVLFCRFRASWGRAALFAAVYFLLAIAPVLGFIDMYFLTYSRVADHWQYLAAIGVISAVCATFDNFLQGKQRFIFFGIVGALSVLTWQRGAIISDSEKLWRDTLAKNPGAWVAHLHLGDIASKRGELDVAAMRFGEALALNPNSAEAHFNLANTLVSQGNVEKATSHFLEAIRCRPRYPEAHYNLGLALEKLGKTNEAIEHYDKAAEINPNHSGAHNNLGNLLSQLGKNEEAVAHYERALQINPNLPEAHNNLANVLQQLGKTEEAIPHYLQAIALKPGYADAHNNLAVGLEALGRPEEAKAHREAALKKSNP